MVWSLKNEKRWKIFNKKNEGNDLWLQNPDFSETSSITIVFTYLRTDCIVTYCIPRGDFSEKMDLYFCISISVLLDPKKYQIYEVFI